MMLDGPSAIDRRHVTAFALLLDGWLRKPDVSHIPITEGEPEMDADSGLLKAMPCYLRGGNVRSCQDIAAAVLAALLT